MRFAIKFTHSFRAQVVRHLRERERGRERDRQRDRETKREAVSHKHDKFIGFSRSDSKSKLHLKRATL